MHLPAVHTLALALAAGCAYAGAGLATDDRAAARSALAGSWSLNPSLGTPPGSVAELMPISSRLTVALDGERVSFRGADGLTRVFIANGSSETHPFRTGTIETTSRWDGGALVMELNPGGPSTITRTFTVRGNPRRLEIVTRDDGGPSDAKRTAVYDASDDASMD